MADPIHPALNYAYGGRCDERWRYSDGSYGERCVLAGTHEGIEHLALLMGDVLRWANRVPAKREVV